MSPSETSDSAASRRLLLTLKLSCYWLMAQGLVQVLLTERLAYLVNLRFQGTLLPYIRQGGLAMLLLGFLLRRSVSDPRRQTLAVDLLALFFLARASFMLAFRLGTDVLLPMEWMGVVLDLSLAVALLLWRSRSAHTGENESLLSEQAPAAAKRLMALASASGRSAKPVKANPAQAPLTPPEEAQPGAAPTPIPAPAPKQRSEALPRMD